MKQNNTKSIVRLSANEINNVSGGKLPMEAVITIGIVGTGIAQTICPYGALITLGIAGVRMAGLVMIVGNKYKTAFRKAVNAQVITVMSLFGLKLQQTKVKNSEDSE